MKIHDRRRSPIVFLLGTCLISLLTPLTVICQGYGLEAKNIIEEPEKEEFIPSSEVVIPWRDSFRGCTGGNAAYKLPRCPRVTWPDIDTLSTITLYDSDRTIWYRFSLLLESPDFFLEKPKADFKPLAPTSYKDIILRSLVLRLVGESKHWYKVEVNEQTRATKFILKSDPNTIKSTWTFLFNWSMNVVVDQDRVKLRDGPDGEVIKEYAGLHYSRLQFLKLDGDWMYVEGIRESSTLYYGWIRWRKGRDILVGSFHNNNKIPEITIDDHK